MIERSALGTNLLTIIPSIGLPLASPHTISACDNHFAPQGCDSRPGSWKGQQQLSADATTRNPHLEAISDQSVPDNSPEIYWNPSPVR